MKSYTFDRVLQATGFLRPSGRPVPGLTLPDDEDAAKLQAVFRNDRVGLNADAVFSTHSVPTSIFKDAGRGSASPRGHSCLARSGLEYRRRAATVDHHAHGCAALRLLCIARSTSASREAPRSHRSTTFWLTPRIGSALSMQLAVGWPPRLGLSGRAQSARRSTVDIASIASFLPRSTP